MTTDSNHRDPVSAIATLDEPKRRQLYDYVALRHDGVGRDEAAAASGMSRARVVPSRPARGCGPPHHGVPPPQRAERSGRRATGEALPAIA